MRYVARQPDDSVNVSKTHPLSEAAILIAGLSLLFATIALVVIFLVELSLRFVSVEDEAALFGRWMPQDLTTVANGDERQLATQKIVDQLALHWPDSHYEFRVEIDTSDAANAMALPGGLIIVTEGLLDQVESENELAFVLGHELGHFKNRDHLRAMGRGVLLAIVVATISGGDADGIGITVADLALRQSGRAQETAADRYGLSLVHSQYGHVDSAWKLFERWQDSESEFLSKFVTYVSSHPQTGERIKDLVTYAASQDWSVTGTTQPLPWNDN